MARYFVEAGAHDGVGDSQTLHLERAGWDGLCIEPSSYFQGLQLSRKCSLDNRPLGDGKPIEFYEIHGTELSGSVSHFQADGWNRHERPHSHVTLNTVTLHRMLKEHDAPSVIDLLVLDTEGSELAILKAHDFNQYSFLRIVIEYNGMQHRREELTELLYSHGYSIVDDDGINLTLELRA
jgi:FkbM family methyltransferase